MYRNKIPGHIYVYVLAGLCVFYGTATAEHVVPPLMAFVCGMGNVTLSCDQPKDHVVSLESAGYGQDKSYPCETCNGLNTSAPSGPCSQHCMNHTDLTESAVWMTCLQKPVCVLSFKDIFSTTTLNPCGSLGGQNYLKVVYSCIKPEPPAAIVSSAALAVTIGPIVAIAVAGIAIVLVAFLFYHKRRKAAGKPRQERGPAAVALNPSPTADGSPERVTSPEEPLKPYDPENIPYVDDSDGQIDA
ncbi:uncharacterized protein LOC106158365 [Lingula anatina]|uniref:Uncharacterized protein LOC106158365 n=1 Tax=Lingula anatina TaxID=7574 RepID=A0A1S3HUN6_LINAN|nr:uncharacterized protein LOC106158365 [Lingula anatina]|eukprot:XP_013389755.1 uncharacterized protein LOC106158365 [Lingula anatina]